MANDILWLYNESGFALHAEAPPGSETFSASTLQVAGTAGPGSIRQTLHLKSPFDIPRKLLMAGPANGLVFRGNADVEQLSLEEWAALRERLRRRLAQPFEVSVDGTDTLFELQAIASRRVAARLWLMPEIIDRAEIEADDVLVRVEADASLDIDLTLTAGAAASLKGRWRLDLRVKAAALEDAVDALLAVDLPSVPAFDLDWPRVKLPRLTFAGLGFPAFGRLPSLFPISLPPFANKLTFAPDEPLPDINVSLVVGDLSLATAAPAGGKVLYDGTEICGVSDATFGYDGVARKHSFTATLRVRDVPVGQPFPVDLVSDKRLPFSIRIAAVSTTVRFDPIVIDPASGATVQGLTLAHELTGVRIAAIDDPALFVVVDAGFETAVQSGGGIRSKLTELRIAEPFPLVLIAKVATAAVEAVGELIRLVAAIPLPNANVPGFDIEKLTALLALLGRMTTAAMMWLAKQAGEAAGLLAGAVEAVAKLIGKLVDALADASLAAYKAVCIEIRLDARTYRIRQIVLSPANDQPIGGELKVSALGFDLVIDAMAKPSVLIDFGPESWFGLVVEPVAGAHATLSTDLWLDKETGPQQPLRTLDNNSGAASGVAERLIVLKAEPGQGGAHGAKRDVVVAAVQRGRLRLFQRFVSTGADRAPDVTLRTGNATFTVHSTQQSARLEPATIGRDAAADDIVLTPSVGDVKGRILGLLSKAGDETGGGGFTEMLSQRIQIDDPAVAFDGPTRTATLTLDVTVYLGKGFRPQTKLVIAASLDDLSMKVAGGDRIAIKAKNKETRHFRPLGFDLEVRPKEGVVDDEYEQFYLDLSGGGERLGLGRQADAFLSYNRVASAGKGLQFQLSEFAIGRSGLDLEARIKPDPVRLGGVDTPFTFTSGAISIKGSRFGGGSLAGSGQLPKELIGEAKATVALTLGRGPSDGDVVVEAATALIDKSGDPIRCHSTRFDITITEVGFSFVMEESYHFFFLVTGSARFNPGDTAFARGLLKNFQAVEIRFDKAPLTRDPRVLMRAISFLVKLKPPKLIKLFDIFRFELRSIAFYPATDKFGGEPAMGFGGQVNFLDSGDRVSIQVNFHEMLIGPPAGTDILPRIRFDGLGVAISLNGVKIGGTAITVDGDLPSLYRPAVLPKNIAAQGFLASGFVEIQGWAPMSATLGFLELKDKASPGAEPRHAFFIYGQTYKMSEPIDTPIGTIYLREVGFGFGYRYTLAGIAQVESAKTPQELVRVLDEVSKYQGSLDRFEAWEPTYDNADLTLALRGMLALSAAQRSSSEYNDKAEARLPNPLLLDIVAALRTDLTILISLRAWMCVNYHKWVTDGADADWKRAPVFRGYLYFSAPKREFLGRFVSNRNGFVGEHPPMPPQLKAAIQATDFSAALYIRPGLFHFELGWPYELGFELGKRGEVFYLDVRGGLIQRVEDSAVLQGVAVKAYGEVRLEGRIGADSFGAAAVAQAAFNLETRLLSYLSLRNIDESMYYGHLRLDILIDARIEVWLSFKVFGKRIRLSAGFSICLAVSIAIEGVVSPEGLGGRAHASVGIRAFGRTASVGIGFSFRDDLLNRARARVAGFMALGLSTPIPDRSEDGRRVESNPPPEPPRHEQAAITDQTIDQELGAAPAPAPVTPPVLTGRPITATNFWAMLFPTSFAGQAGKWYVMQLVPRDHTAVDKNDTPDAAAAPAATFFASPTKTGDAWQAPFHALASGIAVPQEFFQLPHKGSAKPVAWAERYETNGAETVDDGVTLNELLFDLFLDPDAAGKPTEPFPRFITPGQELLADDSKAATAMLARQGRSRIELSALRKREAQIEEARSAILASALDTVAQLAAHGVPAGLLPRRYAEVDARDFGLTFVVSEASLAQLFPELAAAEQDGDVATPPLGAFTVVKSDAAAPGTVHLFNPPSRMFRKAQPRFTPRHVIGEQGIMLDWDLEPAWGESQGAYHDPEFHLRHYRVRRTIRGHKKGEFRAEFVVKAAAPTRLASKSDVTTLTMLRPPFQFIDDLRQKDPDTGAVAIPEQLREVLLKQRQLTSDDTNTGVDILYEIVPVDIAGTSDFGEPYEVPVTGAAKPLPVSPRHAVLQLAYDKPGSPAAPKPRFLFTPKPKDGSFALHLRILTEKVEALGTYGNDAMEQAGRFDERSIERLRGSDVAEFVLKLKPGTASDSFVFQNEDRNPGTTAASGGDAAPSEESEDLTPAHFGASIQILKDGKLTDAKLSTILTALDADDASIAPGLSRRLFVRRLAAEAVTPEGLHTSGLHGEWRSMPVNLVLARAEAPLDLKTPKPLDTILETFEQPVALRFMALRSSEGDADCESGRLHLIYPPATGTIDDLLAPAPGREPKRFPTLRDPARRTATRLKWRVNAASLRREGVPAPDHAELYRWVGGYDLHVVDPDALPALSKKDDINAQLESAAKPVGRVALMPAAFDGLEPSGFGDFGRLEAAYPSETLRLLNPSKGERASGMRRAGWYSPAESTALFPQPALRRSLMPDPDEALLATLFAHGRPDVLRISIPVWLEQAADPLVAWRLAVIGQHGAGLGEYDEASVPVDLDTAAKAVRYRHEGGFTVAQARRLLQNLRLVPEIEQRTTAYLQETETLQRRIDDPAHLAAVGLRIEVLRARQDADGEPTEDFVMVTSCEHVVDLVPALHPVLGDALAFLPYASQRASAEIEDGRIFRRYSSVADPEPEVKATSFADWLDETPPERDPYGWGALRTLGLARGLRLYDSVSGEYLRGSKLMERVRIAMRRALLRYRDTNDDGQDERFNGQPFVDLLTKPWGNAKLFSFDGSGEGLGKDEQGKVIDNETLAVIQVALRPAPDRLARAAPPAALARVRYFKIVPEGSNDQRPEWRLKLAAPPAGRWFDVLARAGGIESNPPIRLADGVVHAFRVSTELPKEDKAIAIVRVILRDTTPLGAHEIDSALTLERVIVRSDGTLVAPEPVPYTSEEIEQPVVVGTDNERVPDPAFGKFETLEGQEWADALFCPELDAPSASFRLSPVVAFANVAYPLARRFGRITLPQGMPVANDPEVKEAEAARAARAELAAGLVRFWTRYLDHCAPRASEAATVFFSLGTVADPGVWRRAPDPSGFVSVTIPDAERRGARRKFAIRPFGRYESWIKALEPPGAVGAPPDLVGALDAAGFASQFLDVTLPRTEPLEKPVILAAQRRAADDDKDLPRMEIVVAHGTDMVLAQANRRNDAMLAPLGISVGYRREFPHRAWMRGLLDDGTAYDALAAFGAPDADANFAFPALGETYAKTRLVELRKLVPDAWLGSTLISAASLPYFFRTHALVHMSAGIVVSDTTRAVFEEGFAEPHLPFRITEGYDQRTESGPPTYEVVRDAGKTTIVFDLALHRFIDCMSAREAVLWFGNAGQHWTEIRNVVHLPEPGISYRISVDASLAGSGEVVARAGEFDLLPVAPREDEKSAYLVQSTGQLLVAEAQDDTEPLLVTPTGPGDDWRVRLAAVPRDAGALQPFSQESDGDHLALLNARLAQIVTGDDPVTIDVLADYVLTCGWQPAAADWTPLWEKAMAAMGSAPEAQEVLRQWEAPPQQGDELTVPLSYPTRHHSDALQRLDELCKVPPQAAGRELLRVRPLPSDDDLRGFRPGDRPTPVETELWKLLLRVAATQLFGPGRSPVVSASKGTLTPLHHSIARRIEGELR